MQLVVRAKNKAITITNDGLAVIERMAANGNANATIAKALGTSAQVLRKMLDADERVALAYDTGKARLADELTDILLTHAREGNVTAAIYLSKARLGWRDQGPSTATTATQVNIHIPAPMSDEDFKKMIQVKSEEVPGDDQGD